MMNTNALELELCVAPTTRLRTICERNDHNGEFGPCTREELLEIILRWCAEEGGDTMAFLLALAPESEQ